ncbi:hypothetical protein SAMN02745244_00272 [Tessaracoccus bendigoensis DSM 12906]|uniref:50S ribosomal protein L4 n=1 Tax=Tessaracoccus bendigoensis DSM 12906 TaxID=1123357 RepID=A0A1M6ATX7_9ACTN|nr:hypothetical protein SAMN02745244_00272 [Tessaracoccus bendigoensis DSM 12906]
MKKSQELTKAAAETVSAAAEYSTAALKEGLDRAQDLLAEAQKQAAPMLHDAKVRTADLASRKLDDFEPHIKETFEKVSPAVDAAMDKVTDDLLPKLQDALHTAAGHVVAEVEEPKKKSKLRKVGKFLAISALVAGAVAAVRHFLAPKDDGWTAHEPSKAYVNNNDTFSNAAKFASDMDAATDDDGNDEVIVSAEEVDDQVDMTSEGAPAPHVTYVTESDASGYGEGSYVGTEPPEGYSIKGNERSKKYHLPGTGGYERTIAEVWFTSEEAAEAAGFTKAQR